MKSIAKICIFIGLSFSTIYGGGNFVRPPVIPIVDEIKEDVFYVGIGAITHRVFPGHNTWVKPTAQQDRVGGFSIQAGYEWLENLYIEGRLTKSFVERNYADLITYSIFLKPRVEVFDSFSIYALLGVGGLYIEGIDGGKEDGKLPSANPAIVGEEIINSFNIQFGFGAEALITDSITLFIDYDYFALDEKMTTPAVLYDRVGDPISDMLSVDALIVGINYRF